MRAAANGERLAAILARIDGRGYRAYRDIEGCYDLGRFEVEIAHVQGDPYAPPSRVHGSIDLAAAGFAGAAAWPAAERLALTDFLGRALEAALARNGAREIEVDRFGQQVLARTVVRLHPERLEARLAVHLPAAGRRIKGHQAAEILTRRLPAVLAASLPRPALDAEALARHTAVVDDHRRLTEILAEREWIAFVTDGSLLPRRGGHDDRPLRAAADAPVVAFESPPELAAEIELPHAGRVRGMAIPRGVTLLVGGGFHGKSTLLDALARGIYPHRPGDGRELVAADSATVKVRAEDGRAVTDTDISAFIGDLPYGRSTASFTTQNASGSTSQAANIIEALEAGARVLLLDEDTSATNFMIRDEPMRRLLRPGQEPIRPFLDRVRRLYADRGISSILVVGGSGEYFRVADRVIQMDRYQPVDVTPLARRIASAVATERRAAEGSAAQGGAAEGSAAGESAAGGRAGPASEAEEPFPLAGCPRRLALAAYRRRLGPKGVRVKAHGTRRIVVEREEVELGACEQLVSPSQTRTLGEILARLIEGRGGDALGAELHDGFSAAQLIAALDGEEAALLDRLTRFPRGDLAAVRPVEALAMLNRLRALQVSR